MAKADTELRLRALELAMEGRGNGDMALVLRMAGDFYNFLTGTSSTAIVAAAPPVTDEPARLDDPAVQAETAETLAAVGSSPEPTPEPDPSTLVTERPTVQGNASTAAPGTSSAAPAASSSSAAPPTADAPSASASSPSPSIDLAKVQAAVIAASKGIGRDATVATLQEHGGARLPDVPTENHAALFAALNDKLAAAGKDRVAA